MNKADRINCLKQMDIVNGDQIDLLDRMGFFTAPASTRFHGAYSGGLFDHSFAVTKELLRMTDEFVLPWKRTVSPWIVGMFHDLCKTDEYVLNDDLKWEHRKDTMLKGHGDKSIILLSQLMTLTDEEILCIRYHMGAYETDTWDQFDKAIRTYETVLWTHTADMMASKVGGI